MYECRERHYQRFLFESNGNRDTDEIELAFKNYFWKYLVKHYIDQHTNDLNRIVYFVWEKTHDRKKPLNQVKPNDKRIFTTKSIMGSKHFN